jgi:hypothetical protein
MSVYKIGTTAAHEAEQRRTHCTDEERNLEPEPGISAQIGHDAGTVRELLPMCREIADAMHADFFLDADAT